VRAAAAACHHEAGVSEPGTRPTLSGHWEILCADHVFENVFALPGVVVALTVAREVNTDGPGAAGAGNALPVPHRFE
jgi:hypothetical protein